MRAAEGVVAEGGAAGSNAYRMAAYLRSLKRTSGKRPPIDKAVTKRALEDICEARRRYYKKCGGMRYRAESEKDVEYEVVVVPAIYWYDPEKKGHSCKILGTWWK